MLRATIAAKYISQWGHLSATSAGHLTRWYKEVPVIQLTTRAKINPSLQETEANFKPLLKETSTFHTICEKDANINMKGKNEPITKSQLFNQRSINNIAGVKTWLTGPASTAPTITKINRGECQWMKRPITIARDFGKFNGPIEQTNLSKVFQWTKDSWFGRWMSKREFTTDCSCEEQSAPTKPKDTKPPGKIINKILIANRSEIAIRISRACKELGIQAVGIYSSEDKKSSHRDYMDQSFLVGKGCSPIGAYLNIPEIICLAKDNNVDAIHPGYGFLSEREDFAQIVIDNGLEFIGPRPQVLKVLGDKTEARDAAHDSGVPIIPGRPVLNAQDVKEFCKTWGCPVILKAAYGGGGRGMRLVRNEAEIEENLQRAQSEALASFGKDDILVEKYIEGPRHIEVQVLGDKYGNVVHLYERDCSMQRRYQKVIQIAPPQDLCPFVRQSITDHSIKLAKKIGYSNAGTVEFLIDRENKFYFIEVNPRVQVEHTLTEQITGIDIIQSQIKIAQGMSLNALGLDQDCIRSLGCAIQCHIRTEDPTRNFQPSTGRLDYITFPSGYGIRLDSSSPYAGQYISPDYDSLLVKIIAFGPNYEFSCGKMRRALQECTASGVVTNLPFLLNVFESEKFLGGKALETSFIDDNPQLLVRHNFEHKSKGEKILGFLAETLINGPKTPFISHCKTSDITPEIQFELQSCHEIQKRLQETIDPDLKYLLQDKKPAGLRNLLTHCGADLFVEHVRRRKSLMLMDTTFRDAHQSLLATRVRTYDLAKVSPFVSHMFPNLFAIEMWGGAIFHTALHYLHECPWERLVQLRELIPNIPFAMLLRGNSLVGYEHYNTEDVEEFCRLAVLGGIDIFRIFDPFNNVTNLRDGIKAVHKAGGGRVLVEAAICYTGDISDTIGKKKYTLEYYENIANNLVESGVNALCIKDMAGLLKPSAAKLLVSSLREKHPHILIHVHSHDTAGSAVASMLASVDAGADIIDVCADTMSGGSSQPAMGTIIACLANTEKNCGIDLNNVAAYNLYWAQVRELYKPFECKDLKSPRSEIYQNEIPGGQYSSLFLQSTMFGVDFEKVKKAYIDANFLLGDIIKVTPSSTIVGDMAIFMVQHDLSLKDVRDNIENLKLPRTVVEYFQGSIGEPYQGFPTDILSRVGSDVQRKVPSSKDKDLLNDVILKGQYEEENSATTLNIVMFPDETKKYLKFRETYGRTDKLPTRIFLEGPKYGEEIEFEFGKGEVAYIKTLGASSTLNEFGERSVFFLYNGQARTVLVRDEEAAKSLKLRAKAHSGIIGEVGAPMPGKVIEIGVKSKQEVKKGDLLLVMSAMKTEVLILSPVHGIVNEIHVQTASEVQENDLLITVSEM